MNEATAEGLSSADDNGIQRKWLFIACFAALVATSFAFLIRAFVVGEWATQFNLTSAQMGEINGAGLWAFAITIILFSLIVDRVGYGKAMIFAFTCHVAGAVLTIFTPRLATGADGQVDGHAAYMTIYVGQFVLALAAGTVEAVINPVVATLYSKDKTKWLAILHAGWPGGFVLAGLVIMLMEQAKGQTEGSFAWLLTETGAVNWQWKVALIFVPVTLYAVLMLGRKFPVQERVASGTSYRAMCAEAGIIGMFICLFLMVSELMRFASSIYPELTEGSKTLYELWGWQTDEGASNWTIRGTNALITLGLMIPFMVYVRGAMGRGLFIIFLLIMLPLAITELTTDQWIKELMGPAMAKLGESLFGNPIDAGWVLIYSATVMLVLRFFSGPFVRACGPLGLLAISAGAAAIGIATLSMAAGIWILAAATVYAIGQTFFWPCMLGLVSERFPRGGALTINAVGGAGMLAAGIIGTPLLGVLQDQQIDVDLRNADAALYEQVTMEETQLSLFGSYRALDAEKVAQVSSPEQTQTIQQVRNDAKVNALWKASVLPTGVCVALIGLILWFRAKGGYRAVDISEEPNSS